MVYLTRVNNTRIVGSRIHFSFDAGDHCDMLSVRVRCKVCYGTTLSSGATRAHRKRITF